MLTTAQKEAILARAGVALPAFPSRTVPGQQQCGSAPASGISLQPGAEPGTTAEQWAHVINALFVEYSAARAAKSLRDAEDARRLGALRQANDNASA